MVFLHGKHEDCENQIGRDEHLDEHSLGRVDSLLQKSATAAYNRHHSPTSQDEGVTHL